MQNLLNVLFNLCHLWFEGLLDSKTGQVVLAGDPKQLGPIIKNFSAQKFGLGKYIV